MTDPLVSNEIFLQQGDIFKLDIITPVAGDDMRLFRKNNAEHGSRIFSTVGSLGKIFTPEEVTEIISTNGKTTPYHTDPFEEDPDGIKEFVVTQATLTRRFIVASQTCDISGVDKPSELHFAMVLPVSTFRDLCVLTFIPLLAGTESTKENGPYVNSTAHNFLVQHCDDCTNIQNASDLEYRSHFIDTLNKWSPPKKSYLHTNKSLIKNVLGKITKKQMYFTINETPNLSEPMMVADLSQTFMLPIACLENQSDCRIGTLHHDLRSSFSQKFANLISRIAVPKGMQPKSILD